MRTYRIRKWLKNRPFTLVTRAKGRYVALVLVWHQDRRP